jgi:hypothetical protein
VMVFTLSLKWWCSNTTITVIVPCCLVNRHRHGQTAFWASKLPINGRFH